MAFDDIVIDVQGIRIMHKETPLRWDDVEHVGINQSVMSIYKNGEYWDWVTVPVANIPNVAVLKQLIIHARKEHEKEPLQRMIATFNTGISLHFGSITVSQQGLEVGKTTFTWSEIAGIDVGKQEVTVKRPSSIWGQDNCDVFPLQTIPDAPLLKKLVDYVLQVKKQV